MTLIVFTYMTQLEECQKGPHVVQCHRKRCAWKCKIADYMLVGVGWEWGGVWHETNDRLQVPVPQQGDGARNKHFCDGHSSLGIYQKLMRPERQNSELFGILIISQDMFKHLE